LHCSLKFSTNFWLESFVTSSSNPIDIAEVILKAVNSSSPESRYHVGNDANLLFKTRAGTIRQRYGEVGARKLYGKEGLRASVILRT
jgi:hypothetical protein